MRDLCGVQSAKVFFQDAEQLPAEVKKSRSLAWLLGGWSVVVIMNPWEFAHYVGYDAHTIFEGDVK